MKIADFGIAKQTDKDQKLTETGAILGSPFYMSPEQNLGQTLDGRCDLYSLGCLMYETLTGQVPFLGTNTIQTLLKHLNEEPPPFATISGAANIPAWLENIVLKALSKNPDDRQSSAQSLMHELDKGTEGFSGKRVRTMRPRFRPTPKGLAIASLVIVAITSVTLQLAAVRHQVHTAIGRAKLSMVSERNTDENAMQVLITDGYQALHDNNIPLAKMYYAKVSALTSNRANSIARADAACGNIAATAIERYLNDEKKIFEFQFETLLKLINETEQVPEDVRPNKFAARLAFRAWKLDQSMSAGYQPGPAQLEELVPPLLAVDAINRAAEILSEAGRRYAIAGNQDKAKECLDRVIKLSAKK